MANVGRPRLYRDDRTKWRETKRRQRRAAVAPEVPCRQLGPHCTLYQGDWQAVYARLPRHAAVVTDPPYQTSYDWTKTRRRPPQWAQNFVGADQPFDPTPWLKFPEVILLGANAYWERLPRPGSLWVWDKTPGQRPSDFASHEWMWLSMGLPPRVIPYLWRGGMRAGEENYVHLPQKLHPAQKPVVLMTALVQATAAPVVIDPFMGSGSTLVACVRLGRPCIGIEVDAAYFAVACDRLQAEVDALPTLPLVTLPPRPGEPRPAPLGIGTGRQRRQEPVPPSRGVPSGVRRGPTPPRPPTKPAQRTPGSV